MMSTKIRSRTVFQEFWRNFIKPTKKENACRFPSLFPVSEQERDQIILYRLSPFNVLDANGVFGTVLVYYKTLIQKGDSMWKIVNGFYYWSHSLSTGPHHHYPYGGAVGGRTNGHPNPKMEWLMRITGRWRSLYSQPTGSSLRYYSRY